MREIPLTKGLVALVDDEDFEWLSQWKWLADGGERNGVYAMRVDRQSRVYMHRLILQPALGLVGDHINGHTLDNRRSNLRSCTPRENKINSVRRGRLPFRGIRSHHKRWKAIIKVDGNDIYLGTFSSPEAAALAYDTAATQYFGEYAVLNFPPGAGRRLAPSLSA